MLAIHPRVLIVDDGSTDGCVEPVKSLPVDILTLPVNRGKGVALIEGFRKGLSDPAIECIATLDADGQHRATELPHLYQAFQERRADLLIGARTFTGNDVPLRSRLGNKATIVLTAIFLGHRVPDTQSGYRLHRRGFLNEILSAVKGGRYETEMEILALAFAKGFTVKSEPIETIYENHNQSSHFNPLRDSVLVYKKLFLASLRRFF